MIFPLKKQHKIDFLRGILVSICCGVIALGFLLKVPVVKSQTIVISPFGGKILAWMPCCNGIWFYTNPLIEGPIQTKILPHVMLYASMGLQTPGSGLKQSWSLLPTSNTLGNEVPGAGFCMLISKSCVVPLPAAGLVLTTGTSLPNTTNN